MGKPDSCLHIPASFLIIAHDLCGVGELSVRELKRTLMNHFISAESLPDLIILIVVVNQKGKYACSHYRMRLEILVVWLFQCVLPLGVSLRNMPQDIISCIAAVPRNQFRAIILLQRQTYIKRLCSRSLDILLTISRVVIPRYSVMSWNWLPLASQCWLKHTFE